MASERIYDDGSHQYYGDAQGENDSKPPFTGSRLPSIFLAQQQPGFDKEAYLEVPDLPESRRLSTITEKTERTERSSFWRPRQQYLVPNAPRSIVSNSSVTTSYGQEIEKGESLGGMVHHVDPKTDPASPSGSAIQRLSKYDPPPSNTSEVFLPEQCRPIARNERLSLKDLPSIPDLTSKSSHQPLQPNPVPESLPSRSQSKLSKLATSRASSVSSSSISSRSESSRSSGTSTTGTIKTYPVLRPSAHSQRPLSSVASSKELPGTPSSSTSSNVSETSSIVRRAIQTAMELETMDHDASPRNSHQQSSRASNDSDRSKTPVQADFKQPNEIKLNTSSRTRPLSKLAALAQQKAEVASRSLPSPDISTASISTSRPLSKLAMLAQQKVDASRVPKLPKTSTEYLTPIANGTSVTTAITTSYQSLYSLTDPSRPNVIPKLDVVPLQYMPGTSGSPPDQKRSKLAMKLKRAGEKASQQSTTYSNEDTSVPPIPPIFQPHPARARASPSAFASVLLHNAVISSKDKTNKEKDATRKKKEHKHKKHDTPTPQSSSGADMHKHPSNLDTSGLSLDEKSAKAFAFDSPSPDDVVLNARKRSALGSKPSTKLSTGSGKS